MSTIPITESAVQPPSSELSDQLTAALAAGEWWAIVEVSFPIDEEPEYWTFTSPDWYGTIVAEEEGKTEFLCSGFTDSTLKTTEQQRKWRQKKAQGPPVVRRSEKAECRNSVKTTNQRKQECRQKKLQEPPVLRRSEKAECGNSLRTTKQVRQRKPQVASVPAGSLQGPPVPADIPQSHPVPTGSQRRGKVRIPEHLRQHLLSAASELAEPVPTKSLKREHVPASQLQIAKVSEPLSQELQQEKPHTSSEKATPLPNKTTERQRLKIPERLREELLQVSRRASPAKAAPVVQKPPERQRLKIPERLREELLQVSRRASPAKAAPVVQKPPERQRLKTPEWLRQELLQVSPRVSSEKAAPVVQKPPERQRVKIPELMQLSRRAASEKEALVPIKAAKRQRPKLIELLKKELLQQKPSASSSKCPQVAPLPSRNPVFPRTSQGAGVLASSPLSTGCLKKPSVPTRTTKAGKRRIAELLSTPFSSTEEFPTPSRTSKLVPVYSGTLLGSSPRQGANQRFTEQHKQKRREQWRQQQRQLRQQRASQDSIDVCEPSPQKVLCVEIGKVPLKPKLGNIKPYSPCPSSP